MKNNSSDRSKSSRQLVSPKGIKFTLIEENIYEGLKAIGEEISVFYLDAVKLLRSNDFGSQNYLISHLLREIDGGLRDILTPLSNETETCKECGKRVQKVTHFEEICSILNVEESDTTAKRWKHISGEFPKLAHRSGAWKEPRKVDEIKKYWNEYERILYRLVGNHLNLLTQMDRKLSGKKPSDEFLATLPNLLVDKSLNYYFFKELKNSEWFLLLREREFFTPIHIYGETTSIVDYLVRVAKENAKDTKEKVTEELINIVNECVDYRTTTIREENPYIVDAAILELCVYIPIERIPIKVLQIIEYSIQVDPHFGFVLMSIKDNFIPYLLKNKREDLFEKFLVIILAYDKKDRTYPDYESRINDSQLLEILEKSKKSIIENYTSVALGVALKLINEIIKESPDEFNFWRVATIENSSQITFYDRYQVQLIQLARDIILELHRDECEKIIKDWLHNAQSIYKRLAYFIINKRYDEFNLYFWEIEHNPLNDDECLHEVYEFLREHSVEFSVEQINKILGWIETADYYIPEDKGEEEIAKRIAYKKREWLSALIESSNTKIENKVNEYKKIDPTPLSHPGHIIWHETTYGFKSPINIRDFKESTVDEVVNALKKIKYSNDSEALDNRGINIQLAELVKNDPMKFSDEIIRFNELSISFKSDVINGLTNAWKEGKQFNWESTLDFVLDIIKGNSFWEKKYEGGYDFRNSFIRYVCELITAGTQNDDNSFDKEYLNKAENILLIFDQNIYDSGNGFNDAATHYLNSTFGKFYDALLNLSLRYARIHKETKQDLWLPSIKQIFSRRLDRKSESSIDISVCLGGFLPNFNFLDHQWVEENINAIFPKDNDQHWLAAMEGYLSFVRQYYQENYILFRNNNHILKAIDSNFEGQIGENLFAHILFAYLSEIEKLNDPDSMICKIIESEKYYSAITRLLWIQRDNPNLNEATVFPLWDKIFNQIEPNLQSEENQRIISYLVQWLCFFNNISIELFEILKFSAKYLKRSFGTVHLIEELHRLRKNELKKVGDLFIELLDAEDFPTYKAEHIQEIVEELYKNTYKEVSNDICIRYAKRNILFLREIYEKYN